jgi:uroporphyrinogen decarboxylase
MAVTSRQLVKEALTFGSPARVPRHLWTLPWAEIHYPKELAELQRDFPSDIVVAPMAGNPAPCRKGDPYQVGEAVDDWGAIFTNIQAGVYGEVKHPILVGDHPDPKAIRPPVENIPADKTRARDMINRFCASMDRFVLAGNLPRPWERYQFMRGTEASLVDVMMPEEGLAECLKVIHGHYLREMEFWVTTDVDGVFFMDDWGSQTQLLIPPDLWRAWFKPLYKDYCDLAHAHGKFAFMHSDGYIAEIYEDLVEAGINAQNSQLFVMDMAELAKRVKGKITFWGEMDRQHVLTSTNPEVGRKGVRTVASHLYDKRGGVIAQYEFGPGTNPVTARAVFEEWLSLERMR